MTKSTAPSSGEKVNKMGRDEICNGAIKRRGRKPKDADTPPPAKWCDDSVKHLFQLRYQSDLAPMFTSKTTHTIHGGMHAIKDGMLAMAKAMGQPVSTTNTGELRELQELIIKSQESTSAAVKDVLTAVRESNENMTRLIHFMMQQKKNNTNN